MSFDCVLFDMDGLLVDSERLSYETFVDVLARQGYGMTLAFFESLLGKSSEEADRRLREEYPGTDTSLRDITPEYIRRVQAGQLHLMAGAAQLLDYLDAHSIPRAVASSNNGRLVELCLSATGIAGRFDTVVHGDMVLLGKPAPDIFLKAAEELGFAPGACLVLEDSLAGIAAANAAGMAVIMVPDMVQPDDDVRANCLAVVDSLADVIPFLEK